MVAHSRSLMNRLKSSGLRLHPCNIMLSSHRHIIITPTVVGVYRDWPGSSASNLYI